MSNQRFLKIVCFRFPTNIPNKIEYTVFVFETKFIIEPKHYLSDQKILRLNSNVLLLLKKVGTHQKVLVLFQNFWKK
jgi:hypothetical protein